jgi:hypothetical protein
MLNEKRRLTTQSLASELNTVEIDLFALAIVFLLRKYTSAPNKALAPVRERENATADHSYH